DKFIIYTIAIEELHIQIFNRWGEQVFESHSINNSWDGKYKGKTCTIGIYYYQIHIKEKTGQKESFTGEVSIVR
ncbi:MAG: gliding motility-associated C-terminal domain-containing protein, partial [Bacteroidota bacterium]|nr:gliding motility-associated C-terminal domain-containing protein [Bacteroidota bacterium]